MQKLSSTARRTKLARDLAYAKTKSISVKANRGGHGKGTKKS